MNITRAVLTLIQQIRTSKRNKHEVVIVLTILAGMLLFHIFFGNDEYLVRKIDSLVVYINNGEFKNHYFYVKYLTSFFRSVIVFLFVYKVMTITLSWRMTILSMFILASMFMDLIFVVSVFVTESPSIYFAIKPFRYLITFNFQLVYVLFEILCIISVFINLTRIKAGSENYHVNYNNNNKYSPSWLLHSVACKRRSLQE